MASWMLLLCALVLQETHATSTSNNSLIGSATSFPIETTQNIISSFITPNCSRLCQRCTSSTQCVRCRPNVTLINGSCSCLPPYILNLSTNLSVSQREEDNYIDSNQPCILCTDKASLDRCQPAFYPYNGNHTPNVSSFRLETNINNLSSVMNWSTMIEFLNHLALHFVVDGQAIDLPLLLSPQSTNRLVINVFGLQTKATAYYRLKGYPITPDLQVELRLAPNHNISVNGSGNGVPRSYSRQVGFKGTKGFQPDDVFWYYLNGTQAFRFNLTFYSYNASADADPSTQGSSNSSSNPDTSTPENSTADPGDSPTTTDNTEAASNEQLALVQNVTTNNFGIAHNFTEFQVNLKQGTQFALLAMSTLGVLGTGAAGLLTLATGATSMFQQMGLYSQSTPNATRRRLYLDNLPQVEVQYETFSAAEMIRDIAAVALTYNPMVLSSSNTEELNRSQSLSTYSRGLVYTNFCVVGSLVVLVLFLLYLNAYTRGKTHYDHSHVFATLSHSHMVVRVLFVTMKGLYPLFCFSLVQFVKGAMEFQQQGFSVAQLDIWNWVYIMQSGVYGLLVPGLPGFGLWYFDRGDRHNVYVYSRMFGEIDVGDKQTTGKQSQSDEISEEDSRSSSVSEGSFKKAGTKQIVNVQTIEHEDEVHSNTENYLAKQSLHRYHKSIKTCVYFVFEFAHPIIFVSVCTFTPAQPLQVYLLISLTALQLALTFYCSVTVCVSRGWAVIKHIQIGLLLGFLVCRLLWDQYDLAAAVGYYGMYVIGCWTVISVAFGGLSMAYWEKKGIGIYVFFATKVFPMDDNDQDHNQTSAKSKRCIPIQNEGNRIKQKTVKIPALAKQESANSMAKNNKISDGKCLKKWPSDRNQGIIRAISSKK